MAIWVVEWTHDDGMDQHIHSAELTDEELEKVEHTLRDRGAVDVTIWSPAVLPLSFDDLMSTINEDLPLN